MTARLPRCDTSLHGYPLAVRWAAAIMFPACPGGDDQPATASGALLNTAEVAPACSSAGAG